MASSGVSNSDTWDAICKTFGWGQTFVGLELLG